MSYCVNNRNIWGRVALFECGVVEHNTTEVLRLTVARICTGCPLAHRNKPRLSLIMVDIAASTPSLRREGCGGTPSPTARSASASLSGSAARACTGRGIPACSSLDRHALAIGASFSSLLIVTAAARWPDMCLLRRSLLPWASLLIAKIAPASLLLRLAFVVSCTVHTCRCLRYLIRTHREDNLSSNQVGWWMVYSNTRTTRAAVF